MQAGGKFFLGEVCFQNQVGAKILRERRVCGFEEDHAGPRLGFLQTLTECHCLRWIGIELNQSKFEPLSPGELFGGVDRHYPLQHEVMFIHLHEAETLHVRCQHKNERLPHFASTFWAIEHSFLGDSSAPRFSGSRF